jgi:hypothetical protein
MRIVTPSPHPVEPMPALFSRGELVLFYPSFATVDSADRELPRGMEESGDLLDAFPTRSIASSPWTPR